MKPPLPHDRRVSFNHETNLWEEWVDDHLLHKFWTAKAALNLTARHLQPRDAYRVDL